MSTDGTTSELGRAVQDVAEKAQVLVREEIALAKAEMTDKVSKLIRGAVVGVVAGVFALGALIFLLHGAAWGVWSLLLDDPDGGQVWIGFAILGGVLLVLAAIAGLLARRFVKKGTPPKPELALEEAQLIKATVSGTPPHARTGEAAATAAARGQATPASPSAGRTSAG